MRLHVLALTLAAAACGQTSHNLYVYSGDAPDGMSVLRLHVESIEAHVDSDEKREESHLPDDTSIDNDGKWRTLPVDRSIDLRDHDSERSAVNFGELGMPEGKVTQVRLVLDLDEDQIATVDGNTCELDLSLVSERGVKINHAFKAFDSWEGNHQDIYVMFDIERSLIRTTDCYQLEPRLELVKVKVDGAEQKL